MWSRHSRNFWQSRRDAVTKSAPLFDRLALLGVGLIGSSIARAARAQGVVRDIAASARTAASRRRVAELGLADQVLDANAAAVVGSEIGRASCRERVCLVV